MSRYPWVLARAAEPLALLLARIRAPGGTDPAWQWLADCLEGELDEPVAREVSRCAKAYPLRLRPVPGHRPHRRPACARHRVWPI